MIRLLYGIPLIVLGMFLECFYYTSRFTNEGLAPWLAIIVAIALNLLLAVAFMFRRKRLVAALAILVVLFSVINTNFGQDASLAQKSNEQVVAEAREDSHQDEIAELTTRIKEIDAENTQILWERSRSLISSGETSRRQDILRAERETKESRLRALRDEATTHRNVQTKTQSTNVYEFYRNLTAIPTNVLQFFFHMLLSIFIAVMMPLGIYATTGNIHHGNVTPKQSKGFIENWAHLTVDYYTRNKKQIPRVMLLTHLRNIGYKEQELLELEQVMPQIDTTLNEEQLIKVAKKAIKKWQKEER